MLVITEVTGTTATENTKEDFSEEESTSEGSTVCSEGSTSVASTVCSEANEASMACSDEGSGNDSSSFLFTYIIVCNKLNIKLNIYVCVLMCLYNYSR